MSALFAVLAQFSSGDKDLPPQSGDFRVSPTAFVIALGVGFFVAVLGHIFRSRTMVAVGIGIIFLATVIVPVYLQIVH